MPNDAPRQGEELQDVMEGLELDPVTAEAPEEGGQSEIAPKPDSEKKPDGEKDGAAQKPTNAEAKDKRITEKKTKITQAEWQETQDTLARQNAEITQIRMEKEQAKFEARNPIVTTEKYASKWEELCKAKANPEHKYHRLDFSDLKKLLFDDETVIENDEAIEEFEETERKKPVSPPAFKGSTVKPKTPGGVDPETYEWLKAKGYSDEEIENSGPITLAGSRR